MGRKPEEVVEKMSVPYKLEPRVVARSGAYTIMIGAKEDYYYVYERDVFVGMAETLDEAIDLIELREGMWFDREDVEMEDDE